MFECSVIQCSINACTQIQHNNVVMNISRSAHLCVRVFVIEKRKKEKKQCECACVYVHIARACCVALPAASQESIPYGRH
jgi:hypothetical protein